MVQRKRQGGAENTAKLLQEALSWTKQRQGLMANRVLLPSHKYWCMGGKVHKCSDLKWLLSNNWTDRVQVCKMSCFLTGLQSWLLVMRKANWICPNSLTLPTASSWNHRALQHDLNSLKLMKAAKPQPYISDRMRDTVNWAMICKGKIPITF